MAELLFQSCTNLGTFLSLFNSSFSYKTKSSNSTNRSNNGHWHDIPIDAIEKIIQSLNLCDRARMTVVCRSSRPTLDGQGIRVPLEPPWVLLSIEERKTRETVSFYSPSEKRVHHFKLPEWACDARFCGSTHNWLVMATGSCLDPNVFLLDPGSGVTLNLPSLTTIPAFKKFIDRVKRWDEEEYDVTRFIRKLEVISTGQNRTSNMAKYCIVAGIFGGQNEELAFCKTQDKSWSIHNGIEESAYLDIKFNNGTLHAMKAVLGHENDLVPLTQSLVKFRDFELSLKSYSWKQSFKFYEG